MDKAISDPPNKPKIWRLQQITKDATISGIIAGEYAARQMVGRMLDSCIGNIKLILGTTAPSVIILI